MMAYRYLGKELRPMSKYKNTLLKIISIVCIYRNGLRYI
jgi:hypothetical protein